MHCEVQFLCTQMYYMSKLQILLYTCNKRIQIESPFSLLILLSEVCNFLPQLFKSTIQLISVIIFVFPLFHVCIFFFIFVINFDFFYRCVYHDSTNKDFSSNLFVFCLFCVLCRLSLVFHLQLLEIVQVFTHASESREFESGCVPKRVFFTHPM